MHQHRSAMAEVVERVRQETGPAQPARARLLLALRAAAGAVARAGRQRPPRGARRRRPPRASCWSRSASSPTTWRSSTTSTPRRWRPPSKLGLPAVRAATPGVDPRFVAMVRDLLVERAAAERGEDPPRAAVGSLQAWWDLLQRRLLPQPPRRTPAGARRCRVVTAAPIEQRRAARPRARRRPRGRRAGPRAAPGGDVDVAATKSSAVDVVTEADRDERGADPRPDPRRPPRRRVPRRGGRRRRGHHRRCAGSSTRSTAPSTSSTASRSTPSRSPPSSTARSSPGWCSTSRPATEYTAVRSSAATAVDVARGRRADRRTGRRAAGRAAGRHRLQLRTRGPRAPGRRRRAGCCRTIRDIRRMGSCALDLCRVAEGTSTATSRRGSTRGTTPPAPWSPGAPGPLSSSTRAASEGRDAVICAPEHGFRTFRDAVGGRRVPRRSRGNSSPVPAVRATRRGTGVRKVPADGAQSGADDDDDLQHSRT